MSLFCNSKLDGETVFTFSGLKIVSLLWPLKHVISSGSGDNGIILFFQHSTVQVKTAHKTTDAI